MGMGYAGNFSVVIEDSDLKKLCPRAFANYEKALSVMSTLMGYEIIDEFAYAVNLDDEWENYDKKNPEQVKAYKKLIESLDTLRYSFHQKTGINLYLGFHNQEDDGDRYDDLSGPYWSLCFSDCFPESVKYKKLKKMCKKYVGIQHYVTFG